MVCGLIELSRVARVLGSTTGVVEFTVDDMRVNLEPTQTAEKGVRCSLAAPSRLRRGDKLYIWESC